MSRYRIELRPSVIRTLRKLEPDVQARLRGVFALLAEDPRPPGARKLQGREGLRVRVGDYRVIYVVEDNVLRVLVIAVRHRREIY